MSFAPKIHHRRARQLPKTGSTGKALIGAKAALQSDDLESTVSSTPQDGDRSPLQISNRMRDSEASSTFTPLSRLGAQQLPLVDTLPRSPLPADVLTEVGDAPLGEGGFLDGGTPAEQVPGGAGLGSTDMKERAGELSATLLAANPGSVLEVMQPFVLQCQSSEARNARLRRAICLIVAVPALCALLWLADAASERLLAAADHPTPV